MQNFGLRLKKLREAKGLELEDLAKIINTSACPLKYWEEGERNLKISQLIKLAKYFGVTTDYLLGL